MKKTITCVKAQDLIETNLELKADLAAEFPLYLYLDESKEHLYYSNNIKDLLDSPDIKKPLSVSSEGLSFLLQSGVIPPPQYNL